MTSLDPPVVIWLGRRVPLRRRQRWLFALGQSSLALLVAGLEGVFLAGTTMWLGPAPHNECPFMAMLIGWLSQRLHLDMLTYGYLLGTELRSSRSHKDKLSRMLRR